ncbi:MAG: YgjP-like metallopeptidase domain-containing protein [Burkholderiales bacterium]
MAASRRPDPAQLPLFVASEPTASIPMRPSPSAPAAPTPSVGPAEPAPAAFRHPQAAREIVLGGHTVGYALKRVRRRSIGFIVGTGGLCVNAPSWVSTRDIEAALRGKANWILGKLQQQREHGRRLQSARVDWRDGVTIPFLGQTVVVVIGARSGVTPSGAVLDASAGDGAPCRLHTGLPSGATPEQIRDAVQSWLQRQARRVFAERCDHYAAQLGVRYRRLSLSSAQTRWGSASADGSIRLSWRLIHFGLSTIDYVVAHELAHLREMNHSPRFWDVVRSVVPDYQRTREVLRTDVLPVFD